MSEQFDIESFKKALEAEIAESKLIQDRVDNNLAFNYHLGYEYGVKYALNIMNGFISKGE